MSAYSNTADSALFSDAQIHDNEKSEQALRKEITASHHLMRNNPLLGIGARRFRASCIGGGAKPIFDPKLFNEDFNQAWKEWNLYCDFHGNTNFAGVQALSVVTMLLDGSGFIIRRRTLDPVPLQLQVVSPLSHASELEKPGKGSYVRGGILYSKNGKVKKYAFYKLPRDHPDFDEESVNWLPASDVIHLRDVLHAGQSAAQPWITSGADFAKQYKDNQTVELKSRMKRNAQKVYALKDSSPSQNSNGAPGTNAPKEKLVVRAGDVTVLNGVKDIKTASPPEIAGNYQEHNNQVLRMIAGILGITFEMLTGDLTQVNYSSIRAGMINHRRFIGQLRDVVLIPAFNRIIGWFIEAYQLKTAQELPGYFENPYQYLDPTWIWPEWEEIDPLKAAKALVLEIQNDITSMEEVSNGRGKTLDQHLDGVKRSRDASEARGLTPNEASTESNDERTNADDTTSASSGSGDGQ
ncbi:phage portal protein [Vibrio europaeus]|uniref:Phage portal protein n=1 Tax=Vibrio europaeus TaxID=300876 RepID=A0ABT5GNV1_9VIBR|nr:phage portal protein [Vibrio europaeus]MDC5723100.1 phage portal protein [Vibrio europaeus]MDC5728057.1 phage portal protein [Vibrio europaeus]MDC5733360.1 phage portal protein [Vibrio europaeus]MDC5738601.1 phage portal protein [Vibrio europaeus]MDC5743837.1 phage portal protein [Vibrio europaeus]